MKKICPLRCMVGDRDFGFSYCQKNQCGWWVTYYKGEEREGKEGECAIAELGLFLNLVKKQR